MKEATQHSNSIAIYSKSSLYTLLLVLLLFTFHSCQRNPYNYTSSAVDEFVIDSYQIKEGKLSILQFQGEEVNSLPSNALEEFEVQVHNGDLLMITLYHPTRTDLISALEGINATQGFRVSEGKIQLPDIGPLKVGGLTLEQARQAIEHAYQQQIDDVEIFLSFKDREIQKVDLAGLVKVSRIPIDGKMRLFDALAIASPPRDANLFRSYISRDGKLLPVDFHRLLKEGADEHNIVLRAGDRIYIAPPEDSRVMITGEVARPQPISIPNGYISLREALVAAGGIPFTGDKRVIQVIRGSITNPKIYTLNWDHILHLPNKSLLLIPGDVVYVSPKPITEWNRNINQLLPSFSGVSQSYGVYKVFK